MTKARRYVALGDLVVDCYYADGKLLRVDGGGSKFNALCNLAVRGNLTCAIGACGNDLFGKIAIESLKNSKVDTKFIQVKGDMTKSYHLILEKTRHTSIKNCPICGKKTWYDNSLQDTEYYLSCLNDDDIIILDGLKDENIPILKQAKQKKVLDIGRIKRLINLTNQEILSLLQQANLDILQLNETVEKYFLVRFGLINSKELFKLLMPNLLVITRGKESADFIKKDFRINKKLLKYKQEIDDTGAGDAFFSVIIQNYFDHNKQVDKFWVEKTFEEANGLTCKVVSHLGARGYIWSGYRPIKYNCICSK